MSEGGTYKCRYGKANTQAKTSRTSYKAKSALGVMRDKNAEKKPSIPYPQASLFLEGLCGNEVG